jgi:NAD-dependent SIR2 family protein deacetylase
MSKENIQKARTLIDEADAIMITSGAGMGVDSGLPDFRGSEGFWKAYPPLRKLGLNFSDIANPIWFDSDPSLAWAFYGHRLHLYNETVPHKGFDLLLSLVKQKKENYFIITSNVDGQFQKAGFDEDKIHEVHGSIHYLQCSDDCQGEIWEVAPKDIVVDLDKFETHTIPKCPNCGAVARPNIMMFSDRGFSYIREVKQRQNYLTWIEGIKKKKEHIVIIEVGAGLEIPTIQILGNKLSNKHNCISLIRINPRDFEVSQQCGVSLQMGGLAGLEEIMGVF